MSQPKIGSGHLSAMGRLGLRELRNAMNPSRESIADTELGLYGSRTPGEVADIRVGEGYAHQKEQERPSPQIELER